MRAALPDKPIRRFQPMLASPKTPRAEDMKFPIVVSPKLDGYRCVIRDGKPLTRKLIDIPNRWIQRSLAGLPALDGELIVGPHDNGVFDRTQSAVSTHDGNPIFDYHVFDWVEQPDLPFLERYAIATNFVNQQQQARGLGYSKLPRLVLVPHFIVTGVDQLLAYEEQWYNEGYEGLIMRSVDGPYKFGRSTPGEGYMTKMVRKQRAEVVILGTVPLRHNYNDLTTDKRGYAKRSKVMGRMAIDKKRVGALQCRWYDDAMGRVEFEVGTGLTAANQLEFAVTTPRGKIATIEFRGITKTGKPRFPSFKGIRDVRDMGTAEMVKEVVT